MAAALVEAYAASVDTATGAWSPWTSATVAGNGASVPRCGAADSSAVAPRAVDFFAAAEGADILDDIDMVDLGALMRRLDLKAPPPEPDESALGAQGDDGGRAAGTWPAGTAWRSASVCPRGSSTVRGRPNPSWTAACFPDLRAASNVRLLPAG